MKVVGVLVVCVLCTCLASDNGLGRNPPMGWTTWCTDNFLIPCENDFCNEQEIQAIAQAMATNGMKELGYTYINLDDCWAGERLPNGTITPDSKRFPSGMKNLADYVHSYGLKLGLYTDVGNFTCHGNRPGSWGYYQEDADTYASWGIDYVKMDWCDHPSDYSAQQLYTMMSVALNQTGRPMFFAICEWGLYEPWLWAPEIANTWRVGPDHLPLWWTPETNQDPGQGQGDANIIQHMAGLSPYAAPGGWNDPDFLMIGEWTYIKKDVDYQTEFSFWCLFSAPLVISTDIRDLTNKQQILNADAIAVNQEWAGYAGDRVVRYSDGGEVWCKPLSSSWAVILYNSEVRLEKPSLNVTVKFSSLPSWPSSSATIYDIWQHATIGLFSTNYTVSLAPHESVFLTLTPQ